MTPYAELERRFHRLTNLEDAAGVLQWDLQVMMPPGGIDARAEQLAALKVTCHELLSDPRVEEWLAAAEAGPLEGWQAANLREMRRRWVHATAVPAALVDGLARAVSRCEMTWRRARAEDDFAMLRPELERVLELVREVAHAKAERLGCAPYDALLDEYEPGGRAESVDAAFAELAAFLPGFLEEVLAHQRARPAPLRLAGPFPKDRQEKLARRLAEIVGYEPRHGRFDESEHPFTEGVPEDVRITTRYDEGDFTRCLMASLHETGHFLYERGRPAAWRNQPVGRPRGMSVHESQSLLIEMQACRSRAFLELAAPLVREAFGGEGPAWSAENLYRVYTRVEPGFIRVDADEVTYPSHVILRYRLERSMVAGELAVADLPGAWREGMRALLGIEPPNDRLGCLQDIHWPDGAWGYFPTYTLGAMTAAQLFDAACRGEPDILPGIARGDFAPLRSWLRANVHAHGSRFETDELVRRATGKALDPGVYRRHLRGRYLGG